MEEKRVSYGPGNTVVEGSDLGMSLTFDL